MLALIRRSIFALDLYWWIIIAVGGLLLALCLQRRQSAQPVRRRDRQHAVPPDRAGAAADPPLHARPRRHRHLADRPAADHLLHPRSSLWYNDRAAPRLTAASGRLLPDAADGIDLFVRLTPKSSCRCASTAFGSRRRIDPPRRARPGAPPEKGSGQRGSGTAARQGCWDCPDGRSAVVCRSDTSGLKTVVRLTGDASDAEVAALAAACRRLERAQALLRSIASMIICLARRRRTSRSIFTHLPGSRSL